MQEEAARQQVAPHPTNYGKVNPGGPMPPPSMQRSMQGGHIGNVNQQPNPGMQLSGNQVGTNIPTDWGAPRYPNNANQGNVRQANQMMQSGNMQQNQVQQQQQSNQSQQIMMGMLNQNPQGGGNQMQNPVGIRPGGIQGNMGGQGGLNPANKAAVHQFLNSVKNGPADQQQFLSIMKTNPQLMAAFLKRNVC